MSLEKEMLAVILKDLPNQTSGVLKSYLEEADSNKRKVERLEEQLKLNEKTIAEKNTSIANLANEIANLNTKIKLQENLDAQAREIENQQNRLDLILAQNRIHELEKSKEEIKDLARTVFRNPMLVKTQTETVPMIRESSPGYSFIEHHSKTNTTTEQIE
jgi:predicted RNase H-like nuclease (RuvC/YqgF family)